VLSKAGFSSNEIAQLDQTGVIATPSAGG